MNNFRKCVEVTVLICIALIVSCGSPACDPVESSSTSVDTMIVSISDSLGLLSGDSTEVFGTITQASWGADGRLYVLDGQMGRLAVFSKELEFERFVGRIGFGPGEFQYPQSFAFLNDGRFAVCDWGGGSVVFFDSAFNYIDYLTGYYPSSPRYIVPGPGNSYVAMNAELIENESELHGTSYIARFDEGMEPERIYDSWPLMITTYGDPDDPDVSIGRVDHDFDSDLSGTVYLAERDDSTYMVESFLADGSADTLVFKEWERIEKTEEQKEEEFYEETRQHGDEGNQMGRRTVANIYPWLNAIGSVDVDLSGNIWVGQGYTEMPTFEVYLPSGDLGFVAIIPELSGVNGLEYCFWNGYLAYDRQPVDYPKVYILKFDTAR